MSSDQPEALIKFEFTHRSNSHTLQLSSRATLSKLRTLVSEATGVPTAHLKLLPRGQRGVDLNAKDEKRSLEMMAIRGGSVRMLVLGATAEEVRVEDKAVEEKVKRDGPRHYHPSMLRSNQPRRTGSATITALSPFHSIVPHPNTPPTSSQGKVVIAYLRHLADDPGVVHVCALHGFQVGVLTELLPHEHPELLGLNENMGQRISLRIRTDAGDGMRSYRDARKVLLHELAHNKVNDHPPEFKELNSLLNAQLEAHERAVAQGTHRLVDGEVYEPLPAASHGDAVAQTSFILGGGSAKVGDSVEGRRRAVLQATMKRLEERELEIEKACGAGGGGTQHTAS